MPVIGIISTYESGMDLVVEWKIDRFFTISEMMIGTPCSPTFSFGGEDWSLFFYPNGWGRLDSSGHVYLILIKDESARSVKQSFSLSLKTVKGERHNEQHFMKDFGKWIQKFELNPFILRSELTRRKSEFVPEGVLTVVCTMKRSAGCATAKDLEQNSEDACTQTVGESIQTLENSTQTVGEKCDNFASGSSTNPQENKVLYDLKELFLNKEDCDVIIKVKGSEFLAHRVILKARSPVFASTFRHDMKENTTGLLEIQDCDSSIFSDFLCFLYCGDVGIISQENVFGLFTAADKYQVLDLRAKCLEFMKKNVTVDNFCETISSALRHSETELIKLCTDYFKENVPKIIVTVKWQTFLAENPTESNELFVKFFVPNSS